MSELWVIKTAVEAIIAEASAFSEYDEHTEAAFQRIISLAKDVERQLKTIELVE